MAVLAAVIAYVGLSRKGLKGTNTAPVPSGMPLEEGHQTR